MGMTLAQGAAWGVLHDEYGRALFHREVEHAYNLWVGQLGKRLCLNKELLYFFVCKRGAKQFKRGAIFKIEMLAEIDVGETTLSDQTDQAVVAQLLSCAI